jgi:O-antigen/teichoic acid export membrane protein
MDNFFLEINSTKTELATFSSAYSLYQTAQLFFFALITSQMILLIKNYKYFFVFLLPLVVLAIFTVYIFSPFIYDYLFKVEYNGGEHLLNILILALIPSVFNFYCITKNNYYDRVVNNIYILTIVFLMKFSVYLLIHPDSAIEYIYVIIITESVISVSFIVQSLIRLNKITVYENTSD